MGCAMSIRVRRFVLPAVLIAACLSSSCAGFRNFYRGVKNTNMRGDQAPALVEGDWLHPDSDDYDPPPPTDWTLLVFFVPW